MPPAKMDTQVVPAQLVLQAKMDTQVAQEAQVPLVSQVRKCLLATQSQFLNFKLIWTYRSSRRSRSSYLGTST